MSPIKIVAIRAAAVANVLALFYGALGMFAVPLTAYLDLDKLTLPLGFIFFGNFALTLNLKFNAPTGIISGVLMTILSAIIYIINGWISGFLVAIGFNFIAKHMGGIPATGVTFATEEPPPQISGTV